MSENTNTEVIGQIDAFTNEVVETNEVTLAEIVDQITNEVFQSDLTISPYKIAKIINKVFESTMTEKQIPAQMMYQYASKGMISKNNKSKEYTKDEVTTYVNKYTSKHVEL
jgi:hypothetical protein